MSTPTPGPWYKELNRYHWFVFFVAALGWMFDCLDQQLFNLARAPAMKDLVTGAGQDPTAYAGYATSIFLIGWAMGGLFFGVLGDRIGRAKTMLLTILIYSFFTGFSAFSVGFWDFALFRFLTGLGVGGEFAVGVALVAEVMPHRARPFALGLLQALSAIGNITAAFISMGLGQLEESGVIGSVELFGFQMTAWRVMFMVGTLPALLAVVIRWGLREPEQWQAVAADKAMATKSLGSYGELFSNPTLRKHALLGMLLASAGVIGLWGIGFFSIDFNRSIFRQYYQQLARDEDRAARDVDFVRFAVANPEQARTLATGFRPDDLISPTATNKVTRGDFETLYRTALALHDDKKSVTTDTVLDRLDQDEPAIGRRAQTAEDRQRRAEFLAGPVPDENTADAIATEIRERSGRINGQLATWGGITSLMINIGAFLGMYSFSRVTHVWGRKPTFAVCFVLAMLSTALVFGYLDASRTIQWGETTLFLDVFWMIPIMGFCQLSLFGGYAIYFPELFPTRLRSTGTSFCYNVGRFVAAIGPYFLGVLTSVVYVDTDIPYRWAGLTMCSIFLIGLLALPFLPETNGKPLPD